MRSMLCSANASTHSFVTIAMSSLGSARTCGVSTTIRATTAAPIEVAIAFMTVPSLMQPAQTHSARVVGRPAVAMPNLMAPDLGLHVRGDLAADFWNHDETGAG